MSINDFEEIRKQYNAEQVLRHFGINFTGGKILCPVHKETAPSVQIYDNGAYCFGCKRTWDVIDLAKLLLEQRDTKDYSYTEVFQWFAETTLPEKGSFSYSSAEYLGPVPQEYITFWHNQMTPERYDTLYQDRLLTEKTAKKYQLGWRGDWQAWTVPFWQDEPGNSPVEIVQFRLTAGHPKYLGLKGHNRGAVQNAHLLKTPQPYVVVLLGAYDALLALQDGVIAVGLNGSMPFKKEEKERVQYLFRYQNNIYIVPDNTSSETKPAQQLAEWLNTWKVRFFPPELPSGCDYIDYRKLGYTAYDFRQYVMGLDMDDELLLNVAELLNVGDPYNLARYHACYAACRAHSAEIFVQDFLHRDLLPISILQRERVSAILESVKTEDDLFVQMEKVSRYMDQLRGGW